MGRDPGKYRPAGWAGRWGILLWFSLGLAARGQDGKDEAPTSLFDLRLAPIRRASVVWESRRGPTRKVVDQVALVRDPAEFLRAISAWDDSRWFPILIEDPTFTPKFLRAFRPSRIVTMPDQPSRPADWSEAVRAVERSWSAPSADPAPRPSGNAMTVPRRLGRTPPGLVVSRPHGEGLAAAVALSAGRFQPMVAWAPRKTRRDAPSEAEAMTLAADLRGVVARAAPRFDALGDDCDFLTLVGDFPDRYSIDDPRRFGRPSSAGIAAFDDLIGRDPDTLRRWAFAGRISGDPAAGVYRAMASLFLQPESVAALDTYGESNPMFAPYAMHRAGPKLKAIAPTTLASGDGANASGWHRLFDPENRHGLVIVNSSGSPSHFRLLGSREGSVSDIPPTAPAAVLFNHSFSAAHPDDPNTIAGRWLANGAFLYYGSMNEPFVQAFRTPQLVASLLAEGMPVAAAVRTLPEENLAWGTPWRLHLLGDPLYRIDREPSRPDRVDECPEAADWQPIDPGPNPPRDEGDQGRLKWAVEASWTIAALGDNRPAPASWVETLLAIRREAISPRDRPIYDGLLIDFLPRSGPRRVDVLTRLEAIAPADRPPAVNRAIETDRAASSIKPR